MRTFEQRFPSQADPTLVRQLDALPAGSIARNGSRWFVKEDDGTWGNDFRTGMRARDIASVLGSNTTTKGD